jgi:hypothetical protein
MVFETWTPVPVELPPSVKDDREEFDGEGWSIVMTVLRSDVSAQCGVSER